MAATTESMESGDAEPDNDGFELPEKLTDEEITDTRRELFQLLYEEPGHSGPWYNERLDVSDAYFSGVKRNYPEVFDYEEVTGPDIAGTKHKYRLADDARKALLEEGVIEGDEFCDFVNEAEEPAQQVERGNVKVKGTIDLTDEPVTQSIGNRPVKGDTSGESDTPTGTTAEEIEEAIEEVEQMEEEIAQADEDDGLDEALEEANETVEEVEQAIDEAHEPDHTVALDDETLFTIMRTADEEAARQVFEQALGDN